MYFYLQSTGQLQRGDGNTLTTLGTGYAGGNCGRDPEGVNNPDLQDVSCIGPLPQGVYTIQPPEDNVKLGPCAMRLIPELANEMFGRAGFFIHGDTSAMNHSASEGCIILSKVMRSQIAANLAEDNRITVTG